MSRCYNRFGFPIDTPNLPNLKSVWPEIAKVSQPKVECEKSATPLSQKSKLRGALGCSKIGILRRSVPPPDAIIEEDQIDDLHLFDDSSNAKEDVESVDDLSSISIDSFATAESSQTNEDDSFTQFEDTSEFDIFELSRSESATNQLSYPCESSSSSHSQTEFESGTDGDYSIEFADSKSTIMKSDEISEGVMYSTDSQLSVKKSLEAVACNYEPALAAFDTDKRFAFETFENQLPITKKVNEYAVSVEEALSFEQSLQKKINELSIEEAKRILGIVDETKTFDLVENFIKSVDELDKVKQEKGFDNQKPDIIAKFWKMAVENCKNLPQIEDETIEFYESNDEEDKQQNFFSSNDKGGGEGEGENDGEGEGERERENKTESSMKNQKIDEYKIDEQKINQQKINEQNIDEQKIDEQKINQQKINEQNIDEQKIDEQKINEQMIDEQNIDEQNIDVQKIDEQKIDEQKSDEQKIDEQKIDEQKIDEQKIDEQTEKKSIETFDEGDLQYFYQNSSLEIISQSNEQKAVDKIVDFPSESLEGQKVNVADDSGVSIDLNSSSDLNDKIENILDKNLDDDTASSSQKKTPSLFGQYNSKCNYEIVDGFDKNEKILRVRRLCGRITNVYFSIDENEPDNEYESLCKFHSTINGQQTATGVESNKNPFDILSVPPQISQSTDIRKFFENDGNLCVSVVHIDQDKLTKKYIPNKHLKTERLMCPVGHCIQLLQWHKFAKHLRNQHKVMLIQRIKFNNAIYLTIDPYDVEFNYIKCDSVFLLEENASHFNGKDKPLPICVLVKKLYLTQIFEATSPEKREWVFMVWLAGVIPPDAKLKFEYDVKVTDQLGNESRFMSGVGNVTSLWKPIILSDVLFCANGITLSGREIANRTSNGFNCLNFQIHLKNI